ncbi:uncharacterized protein LOC126998807 [Eriocheir sinensis]|uniref:uncharacterized protein LOC126998807 n=1 Tax=Eriocheir sinensis TaxID=95602 RepID=UPI0021C5C1E1|nr:uncharacterized protein LOC126998807 [Eriocheir sinensis]
MTLATAATVPKLPHHEQLEFCMTRARYRQGRKLTAVRVYTVNDESNYLIVNGVPAIKISNELETLCHRYGEIEFLQLLPDYPHEDYVEVYLVKFRFLKNARFAKKQLDGKSFYGHVLHVCYAPELETVDETREKLQDRRKTIAALTRYRQDTGELNLIRKPRVMPPTAARYINQLRPDLREETLDRLHYRVDEPATSNTELGQEVQRFGNRESWTLSDSSEACARIPNEDEGAAASPVIPKENSGPYKALGDTAKPKEECHSKNLREKKRSSEFYTISTKKIKLFGKKTLLSFKQD